MALRYVPLVLVCLLAAACGSSPPRTEAGPRLYLAGNGEMWIVDADTGRVRHVSRSQLKPSDAPHRILARGHHLVLGDAFGDSAFFLPSARPDRVWVVDLDPKASARAVREVTVGGVTTVHAARVPGGQWPLGAVDEGLLLQAGNGNGVDVWDPITQRVVRRLRPVQNILGAATGHLVTACSDFWCGGLRITDVRTGADRVIRAPSGLQFEPWEAAFSPGGDLLAVPVREPGQAGTEPRHLALVDVARDRLAVIPGSRVPAGYTLVAWSADGRYVFITGGDRHARRVIVGYRLGTRQAHVLDIDVGDFYDMAAI
jgi:hypothetical protein